ncbi:RNA polymerase sigma factor [Plantibacter sp. Mn2098]|uniref:RNA polymerase sigma factor n=1 Tax=Plantibacter sp. Mn2098 TaxID=3395266 RepID=UPI003BD16BF7
MNPEQPADDDADDNSADDSVFDRIVAEVLEPLRRFLARRTDAHTADEVLNETLVVLWRRSAVVPVDAAIPWAIGIARRQLQNAERGARRRDRLVARIAIVDPPQERVSGPGEESAETDRTDMVGEALRRLRPSDAEILRLWAWDELTIGEIATVLGASANAVSIRLHRAKARLRERLGKLENGSGHVSAAAHEPRTTQTRTTQTQTTQTTETTEKGAQR